MIGKGSVNHNSRKFIAENVDATRTKDNIEFCNENIEQVYHQLFDEALEKYNEKQTRDDRKIPDYYEKIRTSKQEKLFHEVIVQIGSRDDMNARDENGQLSKEILIDYMDSFQERNPQLKVFSAHLHLDEETPHLHIDFVPYTTGSKRGLETRVSLRKALIQQGFEGGTKFETEAKKWTQSEKEQLAEVMEKYDVHWNDLGTHKPHLSVLDYKKQEREKEVIELEKEAEKIESKINDLKETQEFFETNLDRYDKDEEWQVPSPLPMMSANNYKERFIEPFVNKLKAVIRNVIITYRSLDEKYKDLSQRFSSLEKSHKKAIGANKALYKEYTDYEKVKKEIGNDKVNQILEKAQEQNINQRIKPRDMGFDR